MTARGGRRARGTRRLPPAFARIAEAIGAGAAAQQALERGERDLAAGLVAERIRVADAFEASYGVPWASAVALIERIAATSQDDRSIAVWPLVALTERLGYVDGLRARALEATASSKEQGADSADRSLSHQVAVVEVVRLKQVRAAYRRGRRYGKVEDELTYRGRALIVAIDARAVALRRWIMRFSSAARWSLRGDLVGRLLRGRRVDRAVFEAMRGLTPTDRHAMIRYARRYALGRASSLRQFAARRCVDVLEARASPRWDDGAETVLETLARRIERARSDPARAGLRRMLREVSLDLEATAGANVSGDVVTAVLNALATPSPAGRAWPMAISSRTPAVVPAIRMSADAMEDASGRRMARAECELVANGSRDTLVAAEGWVRTYRDEADAACDSAADRRVLLARAQAVEEALERRAVREGHLIFLEALALAQRPRCFAAGRPKMVEALPLARGMALATVDKLGTTLFAAGGDRAAESWVSRVRRAVEQEVASWTAMIMEPEGARGIIVGIADWLDTWRERAESLWRWLDGRTGFGWGSPYRMVTIRLIRGRALAVFGLATAVAFFWLDHAATGVSLASAAILVTIVFGLGVSKLATQNDPHWWRSGVSTLGLIAIVGAMVGEPPGSVPVFDMLGVTRVTVAVIVWWTLVPPALLLVRGLREITRSPRRQSSRNVDETARSFRRSDVERVQLRIAPDR